MEKANDRPLIHLHWALIVSLIYLIVLGHPAAPVPAAHLLYVAVLLGGSPVILVQRLAGNFEAAYRSLDVAPLALNAQLPASAQLAAPVVQQPSQPAQQATPAPRATPAPTPRAAPTPAPRATTTRR